MVHSVLMCNNYVIACYKWAKKTKNRMSRKLNFQSFSCKWYFFPVFYFIFPAYQQKRHIKSSLETDTWKPNSYIYSNSNTCVRINWYKIFPDKTFSKLQILKFKIISIHCFPAFPAYFPVSLDNLKKISN